MKKPKNIASNSSGGLDLSENMWYNIFNYYIIRK